MIRTSRSKHCAICNMCIERFDHHCPWINNCVGVHNHNSFLVFIFTLLLILLLITSSSVFTLVDECHPNLVGQHCVMQRICLGCKIIWLRYLVLAFTLVVGLFFGGPASMLCFVHAKNYCAGQTTNERFAKKNRSPSTATEDDSFDESDREDTVEKGEILIEK